MAYCLAIDIGASSGRHLLGEIKDGKLEITEIYRFENGIRENDGTLVWDVDVLCENVIKGLEKCRELGRIPQTVAIDTWGVDYVLLDENGREILPCVAYRDSRTASAVQEVYQIISKSELYSRTGIGEQSYNTVFQLWCDKLSGKMDKAAHMLMMPDYLSYKLTGVVSHEYTICSTTGLVNAQSKTWDSEIIDRLGYKKELFGHISAPCTPVGNLSEEIKKRVGFDCLVMHCPSHDTASAVAACPIADDSLFISSGTWSLVGTENTYPVTTEQAMTAGLSNEGGINYRYRFLKNIMGMWLINELRKDLCPDTPFPEIVKMAEESDCRILVDANAQEFMAPESMKAAFDKAAEGKLQPPGDYFSCAYRSLAICYRDAINNLEAITGNTYEKLYIVGGGAKNQFLNRLTEEATGKKVIALPIEATALGNLKVQLEVK